jgi:hypothetical protein
MALIDPASHECLKSELDLFNLPPTQTSVENGFFVHYHPSTSLDKGGPLDFTIKAGDRDYIDPQLIFLYTRSRILDTEGTVLPNRTTAADASIPDKSVVFPVNYFGNTRFKNLEVYLDGKLISTNDNMYPYHSFLEMLLSYSEETKKNQLAMALYYKDELIMDDYNFNRPDVSDANPGAYSRYELTRFSKPFECTGKLHSGIFSQNKLLPNNTRLQIKLSRADNDFALMAKTRDHRYQVVIEKAVLIVGHKKISDGIRNAHELAFKKNNAKYPMRKTSMRFFTKAAGISDLSEANIVNGLLPRRLVIGLVETDAFNGDPHKNPFNFKHFNVSEIVLRQDGQPLPFEGIQTNFGMRCHLEGYLSLLQGTGRLSGDSSLYIHPRTDFLNGYALYCFDITPDFSESGAFNLLREGKLSLSISLRTASPTSITIVAYLEYDTILEIDGDRRVIYDNIS